MSNFALHLVVEDVDSSLAWYQEALGATVTRVLRLPDRTTALAELEVNGLPLALAAPVPGTTLATPSSTHTSVAAFRLEVADADAAMGRALAAGAIQQSPVQDAFWGVRTGEILDPSGHRWAFDQHLREVPIEEIEARLADIVSGA
jgi:PhnB protein